jgi:hypothetical protein
MYSSVNSSISTGKSPEVTEADGASDFEDSALLAVSSSFLDFFLFFDLFLVLDDWVGFEESFEER